MGRGTAQSPRWLTGNGEGFPKSPERKSASREQIWVRRLGMGQRTFGQPGETLTQILSTRPTGNHRRKRGFGSGSEVNEICGGLKYGKLGSISFVDVVLSGISSTTWPSMLPSIHSTVSNSDERSNPKLDQKETRTGWSPLLPTAGLLSSL